MTNEQNIAVGIVNSVVMYLYNTSPLTVFTDVYGSAHHPTYVNEKVDAMRSFPRWWGMLDAAHRERLVNIALEKYS